MQTKMDVFITIVPKVKSRELYERLAPYKAAVTDLGAKVYVATKIDITEDEIEKIMNICKEYGDASVEAHMVDTPSL